MNDETAINNLCPTCKRPMVVTKDVIHLCLGGFLPATVLECKNCEYRIERPVNPDRDEGKLCK